MQVVTKFIGTGLNKKIEYCSMEIEKMDDLITQTEELQSRNLKRHVRIDFYQTEAESALQSCYLVNDGQDLRAMDFRQVFLNKVKLKP